MPNGIDGQRVETYLLPILLSLIIIACSFLIGSIEKTAFLAALVLVALLVVGAFLAQLVASRQVAQRDKAQLFNTLSVLALARHDSRQESGVITENEVLALEACAREVWIYAYDLEWESRDSPFTRLVQENLKKRVIYNYLVPNDPAVVQRVTQLRRLHADIKDANGLMEFRASDRERTINQFGCTIYNPDFLPNIVGKTPTEPVAVFFPHYANFSAEGAHGQSLFPAVRGSDGTRSIQEAFKVTWNDAVAIKPV